MLKRLVSTVLALSALSLPAAELRFDLGQYSAGQSPTGFVMSVTGPGKNSEWKVVEESVPPVIAPLTRAAQKSLAERPVLAQISDDPSPGRAALLICTNDSFINCAFSARFKILRGSVEPAAGLIFRCQDASNYYTLRASARGNLLWYKVVGGVPYEALGIGVLTPIQAGEWHDLEVRCTGSGIRCLLDGKLAIPPARPGSPTNDLAINDTSFASGKVGFWTKADTVAYFADARVQYTTRVPFMQNIADQTIQKYPRLLGLKIFANRKGPLPVIIADGKEKDIGAPGTELEAGVIQQGAIRVIMNKSKVEITMPLRDRNGEAVAALRTTMRPFPGETENTAIARATIVKRYVEENLATLQDINQ